MRKIAYIIIIAAVLIGGYYLLADRIPDNSGEPAAQVDNANGNSTTTSETVYSNDGIGYSFSYPGGQDGYILQPVANPASYKNLAEGLTLTNKDDYNSLELGEREGGEGPAVINIYVFNNPEKLAPEAWLEANKAVTNFNLRQGELTKTTLAREPAWSYDADGLYASKNIITTNDGKIFFLNGQYMDRGSALYRDFQKIVESFEFK